VPLPPPLPQELLPVCGDLLRSGRLCSGLLRSGPGALRSGRLCLRRFVLPAQELLPAQVPSSPPQGLLL